MPVTKAQLPMLHGRKLADGGYVEPVRPVLRCDVCGECYSATPGDYWNLPDDHVFECCGEPCDLVVKSTRYEPWPASSAHGVRANETRGTGPTFNRWPADRPDIAYVTEDGAFLCVTCANGGNGSRAADDDVIFAGKGIDPQWHIIGAQTVGRNEDQDATVCSHCSRAILPA